MLDLVTVMFENFTKDGIVKALSEYYVIYYNGKCIWVSITLERGF